MKCFVGHLLGIITFLGILDSSFLTYEKVRHIVPPCSAGFQCDTVLTSRYSQIGPVPLSAMGLLFYATIFIFAAINFVERDHIYIFDTKFHIHDILLALSI